MILVVFWLWGWHHIPEPIPQPRQGYVTEIRGTYVRSVQVPTAISQEKKR
jgi:hypothetical protein